MDPAYGDVYRTLYERHWWWRAREAVVCDTLDRRRPRAGWRRVLDVGCGDGLLFRRLRAYAAQVEGVEPDAGLVAGTQRDGGFIHIRPFDLSFRPAHRYDLILFLDVLEHMTHPRSAVAHAASCAWPLRNAGRTAAQAHSSQPGRVARWRCSEDT